MSTFALMQSRRFWPLFWTQFLGAFNDNLFKNALVILITYRAAAVGGVPTEQMVALCGGIFILPFFLFSATAGQLADKYPKHHLVRWTKAAEIGAMGLAALGFWLEHLPFLLVVLFLMGLQSAVFGPVKFGILPQLLHNGELVGGNALVEMGTFLAILLGTIGGGLLITLGTFGPHVVSAAVVLVAVAGFAVSLFVPRLPAEAPELRVRWNPVTPTWEIFKFTRAQRAIFLAVLGVAWFWFFGATVLALFPTYCKDVLGGDAHLVTFFLAVFSIGIGIGSLLCERLSGGKLELGLVPLGSLGMTVFTLDLFFAGAPSLAAPDGALATVPQFLGTLGGVRITVDLFLLAIAGGFFIVPLNTLIQHRAAPAQRSRTVAGCNILSSLLMVLSSGYLMGLYALHVSIPVIFLSIAVLNLAVGVYIYLLIPEFLIRFIAWMLGHILYRLRVRGLEHIPSDGPAVLVCNHVSFVDWLIIGGACRRPVRFVMHHSFLKIPFLGWFFRHSKVI
ncbi:MAG: MFS transporter, partial [Candidatus Hydrogenedentes bacterium]|nr:MFS transporter [Candidatus Hydrogenedentota bacterium]